MGYYIEKPLAEIRADIKRKLAENSGDKSMYAILKERKKRARLLKAVSYWASRKPRVYCRCGECRRCHYRLYAMTTRARGKREFSWLWEREYQDNRVAEMQENGFNEAFVINSLDCFRYLPE